MLRSFFIRLGIENLTMTLRVLVEEGIPGQLTLRTWAYNRLNYPQFVGADRAGGFLILHNITSFDVSVFCA